jgi:lysophospholipase L1-like esterase
MSTRRWLLVPAIFIALVGLGLLHSCAQKSTDVPQVAAMLEAGQQPVRIVCFGDSVTGIYNHSGGRRAWPDMLGIALRKTYPKAKLEVFNAGISGNTTARALARLDRDVLALKPHLVVVMFGLNDITLQQPKKYHDDLCAIVRRCRSGGAAVVLSSTG